MRLFYLLYFNGDRLVWKHFHELVVRLQWQKKMKTFWSKFCCVHSHTKVSKSSKLQYYPYLKQELLTNCRAIYLRFEKLTTFCCIYSILIKLVMFYHINIKKQFSPIQTLSNVILLLVNVSHGILFTLLNLLTVFTLSLVCHIYTTQYSKVNSNLAKVKTMLNFKNNSQKQSISNSLKTRFAVNSYQTAHTCLTVFILHYNSSTISKIVSAYFLGILPLHAFYTMLIYFRNRDINSSVIIDLSVGVVYFWFILMALNFIVARVNSKICQSGPTVGSIFAKKGIFEKKEDNAVGLTIQSRFGNEKRLNCLHTMRWSGELTKSYQSLPEKPLQWIGCLLLM